MADNPRPSEHTKHAQSLAYLSEQGKVTGFEFENKEHISQNPSDLQEIAEAQVVTSNKDNFVVGDAAPMQLQSGPPKTYIDQKSDANNAQNQQQQQANTVPLSNFAYAAVQEQPPQIQQNNVDSFVPSTDDKDKQNYESFFADDSNKAAAQPTDDNVDIFGVIDQKQPNQQNSVIFGADSQQNYDDSRQQSEEKQEPKQTFLSVWQEQHREQLEKKASEERETQEKLIQTAKEELDNFNEQRRLRIEQQRKDAQSRESDLRDDYNAVFQHGTIWQQVAKLVDLKSKAKEVQRMRDLLIILKNQDEKSDQ